VTRVLVIGAMGAAGGSVMQGLLERGHHVRVMTRRPESGAAARLSRLGVEIVHGDLDARPSLRAALRGCGGVFARLPSGDDPADERRRGRNLINALAGSEVDYVVFGTTLDDLESYARSLELPATVVRIQPDDDELALGVLVTPMFDDPTRFVGRTVSVIARAPS
jgi:uncharacterized protein YbjT (DUF2867 family)